MNITKRSDKKTDSGRTLDKTAQMTAKSTIKKGRLARKLLLLRIGVGIVLGITVSSTAFYLARRAMVHQIRDNLASYVLLLEAETRLFIHRKEMMIKAAANDPALAKYHATSRLPLLHDLLDRHAAPFITISYINAQGKEEGRFLYGRNSDDLTETATDNDYRTALSRPGRTVISGARHTRGVNGITINFYHNRRDFFDRDLGTITASVPAADLAATLRGTMETIQAIRERGKKDMEGSGPEGSESFMVVDRSGTIIAHSNPKMIGREASTVSHQLGPDQPHFRNEGTLLINGEPSFIDTIPMGKTGWRLFFMSHEHEALAPVRDLGRNIFLLTIALLVAAELFSRRLGLNLTEPIARLLARTKEISDGGLSGGRVEWKSRDELGDLAESFNRMLDRIEKTQADLRNEKHFIEDIFDAMEEGVVVADIHGEISEHNRAAREILGVATLEGRRLGEFFPATIPVHTWWPEVAAGHHISSRESTMLNDQDEEVAVSLSLAPLFQEAKNARGMVCGIADIRERKKLEEERVLAAARLSETRDELMAAEKLAVVGQMSGMVAHEVLNPISAINIRVSMALPAMEELARVIEVLEKIARQWQEKNESDQLADHVASEAGQKDLLVLSKISAAMREKHSERTEDFRFLERQVTRIIKIIDNLREMSRHQKTVEDFKLPRMLNEVIEDQRDGLGKRGITVRKEFKASPRLRADYMEIYSIFSNLLRNAIQAIDARGGGNGEIVFTLTSNEGKAEIKVSDNGCGMDQAAAGNLFTPGFTSKGRKGTGLGLSYSRKIARAMQGDLVLTRSNPGKGTAFTVILPEAEERRGNPEEREQKDG